MEAGRLDILGGEGQRRLGVVDRRHLKLTLIGERQRQAPGPGAEVESAPGSDQRQSQVNDAFGFGSRDQGPRVAPDLQPPEPGMAQDVGEGLSPNPPRHGVGEMPRLVARGRALPGEPALPRAHPVHPGPEPVGLPPGLHDAGGPELPGRVLQQVRHRGRHAALASSRLASRSAFTMSSRSPSSTAERLWTESPIR